MDTEYLSIATFNNRTEDFAADLVDVALLPVATDVPTSGSAQYTGELGADYYGYYTGSIIGDLDMSVDFGTHDIDGTVTNMIVGDGTHDQAYRTPGTIVLTGTQTDAVFVGAGTGTMLINEFGVETPIDISISIEGDFQGTSSTITPPSAVSGIGDGLMDGIYGDSTMDVYLYGYQN